MCTCVCMCAFLCIQVCVCMHARIHIHIDAKSRDMSTAKFWGSGKETRIPTAAQHVSTTKERRNLFKGHITCLESKVTLITLSPPHSSSEFSQRPPFFYMFQEIAQAQTLFSAFRKLKWSRLSWFFSGVLKELASESLFDTYAEKLGSKIAFSK